MLTGKQKDLVRQWRKLEDALNAFQRYTACGDSVEGAENVVVLRKALRIVRNSLHKIDPFGATDNG